MNGETPHILIGFAAVAKLLDASGVPWQRRTALKPANCVTMALKPADCVNTPQKPADCVGGVRAAPSPALRVLLVDAVGELGAWWGTAQIAFVGGSLGKRGGQNMIEPAAYGAAVSFGPNTRNFRDIVAAMLAHDAAVVLADGHAMRQFVARCLERPEEAATLGQRARNLVLRQLGATEQTLRLLAELIETPSMAAGRQSCAA